VVDVEVSDQQQLNLFGVDRIKIRQRLDPITARVDAAVEHNLPTLALQIDATPADLATRTKRRNLKQFATQSLNLVRDTLLHL
jgi:hypothetical protein